MSVATETRDKLTIAMPMTAFDVIELITNCVKALQAAGAAITVKDQQALIPILAADMCRKAGSGSEGDYLGAARQQIEGNQTTALTTSDDHYVGIEGGAKFDEIHELIHICSGPGGESPQHTWCLKFNEGAINYFSELVAAKLGAAVVARYVSETNINKKMVKLLTEPEASKKLFGSTFQGKIDDFFLSIGSSYRKLGDKQPDGKNKGFSDKGYKTDKEAGDAFKAQTKNWSEGWLNPRLPTL
jgi:hypothetical protein